MANVVRIRGLTRGVAIHAVGRRCSSPSSASIGQLLEAGARRLATRGSSSPRLDAQLLLEQAAHLTRTTLLAHPELRIDPGAARSFAELLDRRAEHEPVAYIRGEREFFGRSLKVDRRVLIPRPETELLVEIGLRAIKRRSTGGIAPTVVDVGTGSGAIAITLIAETGQWCVATDVSGSALTLAQENAHRLLGDNWTRFRPVRMDLLSGVSGPVDVLLANLPYVPADQPLPLDVACFEPRGAIVGGARGSELIERLLEDAPRVLAADAEIALEVNDDQQAAHAAGIARARFPDRQVGTQRDAAGVQRVVCVGPDGPA